MDDNQPRIIARGEWEQDEHGGLLYIPRDHRPPMGDVRDNYGPQDFSAVVREVREHQAAQQAEQRAEQQAAEQDRDRGGYRRASDDTWSLARRDYLAGDTGETVCARYGLKPGTFKHRAAAERWRRADQAEPCPVEIEPVDLDLEFADGPPDYAEMADHALVRLNRAVRAGRASEAWGWMRLHMRLLALSRQAADAPPRAPRSKPEPTMAERAQAVAREIEVIARDALALDDDDLAGRAAIQARVAALDALKPAPVSDDSDHSDPVFCGGTV